MSVMVDVTLEVDGKLVHAKSLDLSGSGMGVWAPHSIPGLHRRIDVCVDIDGAEMKLRGEVVREFSSDGGSVWGIAFRDLDRRTASRITNCVARATIN